MANPKSPINSGFNFQKILGTAFTPASAPDMLITGPTSEKARWPAPQESYAGSSGMQTSTPQYAMNAKGVIGGSNPSVSDPNLGFGTPQAASSNPLSIPTANAQTTPSPSPQGGYAASPQVAASPQPSLGGASATPDQASALAVGMNLNKSLVNQNNPNYSTGYSVTVPGQTNSDVLGSGLSYTDVQNYRSQLASQASQQSPYMSLLNNYLGAYGSQLGTQYAGLAATTAAGHAGDTSDYGTGMKNLVSEQANIKNMQASIPAQVASQGLQAYASAQMQVAPGSSVYNPLTGQTEFQGAGASPAQILSTAQNLAQLDQQQGTLQLNPDGGINMPYYQQQAASLFAPQGVQAGQSAPQAGAAGPPPSVGSSHMSQGGLGGYQVPQPGTQDFYNALPATVAPSYRQTSSGQSYFDSGNLDSAGIGTARQLSKTFGIPILSSDDAKAVQTVDQAQKNLVTLGQNFSELAQNSGIAALASNLEDPISTTFQTNYGSALKTFNNNRDALLQQVRALAGMSPRLSNTELNLSQSALPSLAEFGKDTAQTGAAKLNTISGYLQNAMSTLIPNYGRSGQSSGGTLANTVNGSGGGQVDWGNLQ